MPTRASGQRPSRFAMPSDASVEQPMVHPVSSSPRRLQLPLGERASTAGTHHRGSNAAPVDTSSARPPWNGHRRGTWRPVSGDSPRSRSTVPHRHITSQVTTPAALNEQIESIRTMVWTQPSDKTLPTKPTEPNEPLSSQPTPRTRSPTELAMLEAFSRKVNDAIRNPAAFLVEVHQGAHDQVHDGPSL